MSTGSAPAQKENRLSDREAYAAFDAARVSMVLSDPNADDNPIVYVNRAFTETTGYSARAAVGRNCRFLQGEDTDPEEVQRIREAIAARHDITVDLVNYKSTGESFVNRLMVSPVFDSEGELIYFLGIQRVLAPEDRLISPNAVLHEMREIQHRVKNHLAMIASLIRMHGRGASGAEHHFNQLSRRVESLQVLYEELANPARRRNMDTVELGAYLSRLVSAMQNFDGRPGIRLNVSVDDFEAPTDTAVNIGLVVSEILTNALKHAFLGRETGLVELRMARLQGQVLRIIVSDDGVGMDDGAEWPSKESVGGRVIRSLILQLDGKVAVMRGANGTVVTLDVPLASQ